MTFKTEKNHFILNGKKIFLLSGEIHYFRIKRELWDRHLDAAKEAGLTAVSTYVPWAWHEEQEGDFDFSGRSDPERDLEGWLRRCREHGLHCILKPGPFILAETRGAGLPDWFLEKYDEQVKMHDSHGQKVASDGVSLFHPVYLDKVGKWYDQIMPLIARNEISTGGPVIMMQVCNEIGVFSWLAHQGDYGGAVKERFSGFLLNKFRDIKEINRRWGTDYTDFDDVELPPDGRDAYASKEDRSRDYEWHCFWRTYYGDYLRLLSGMARERGVKVPFYHNLPGWIYGSGYEFPLNITMYDDLYAGKSEIMFGVDHIPEFLSHRNQHDDRIINDITAAMQGGKPLFAAEFQCGSREYHVVTNNREMELFYKASVAHGLTGWNYYMFSQGHNRRHRGYSGETFYWYTPLDPEGNRNKPFSLVKRMNRLITSCGPLILDSARKAEICVVFYPPYYATELERPETGASGLWFNPSSIRRPAYFDGLLRILQVLNIDYDMADLTKVTASHLGAYRQVWAFSTDEMNARDQQVLTDYAAHGGQLVLYPMLPDREMSQQACTILRDSISVSPSGFETIDSPLIDLFGLKDIKCSNPQVVYCEESLDGAEIIARTLRGTACGFLKPLGKGTFVHLGTWMGFDTEAHRQAYEALLGLSGAKLRQASADNERIVVRERFTGNGNGMLFIANYFNEEQNGKIHYTHPDTGEHIPVPYGGSKSAWPPLYGVLSPLCLALKEGLKLLHSTSDILNISIMDDYIEVILYGDRDLPGEIVFEGEGVHRIGTLTLDGTTIDPARDTKRLTLSYPHPHQKEIALRLETT